jgi:hypothetical protein
LITIKLGQQDRDALAAPEAMEFDPKRIRLKEARELERVTGLTVDQLGDGLKGGSLTALAALLSLALARHNILIDADALDVDLSELQIEVDQGEAPAP